MNKNKQKLLLIIGCFFASGSLYAADSHIVTFFVEDYPKSTVVKKKQSHTAGIFFTYFGYKTLSDSNGQVLFPLKTQKPEFFVLVSSHTKPIFMLYNTVHHWEIEEKSKYSLFSVKRKFDEKTKIHFWDTQQIEIDNSLEIPLNTIIVHADPHNIYIPTGISITNDNTQLVLPKIYVKSHVQLSERAIAFLENSELFASLDRSFKVSKSDQEMKI